MQITEDMVFNAVDQELLNAWAIMAAEAHYGKLDFESPQDPVEHGAKLAVFANAWAMGFRAKEIHDNLKESMLAALRTSVGEQAVNEAFKKKVTGVMKQIIEMMEAKKNE